MSANQIGPQEKSLLRKATRQRITEHFVKCPQKHRSTKWIYGTNKYRLECTKRYELDILPPAPTLHINHFIGYVGASSPAHVIDGWAYLGRAVDAALRGDQYSAIHLAYYAELRAAMALLASEGVAIFNNWHAIVGRNGDILPFPRKPKLSKNGKIDGRGVGTHRAVWPILEHWSGLHCATTLLEDIVAPSSISMKTWLTAGKVNLSGSAIARRWLSMWGLDLIDTDHDLRNLASYRPSEFRKSKPLGVHETTHFVEELWHLFEPNSPRRFPNLERSLLRLAWQKCSAGTPTAQDLEGVGVTAEEAIEMARFLSLPDNPLPLSLAERSSTIEDSQCHLGVISRAALLLFVATSSARKLLCDATYKVDDLNFWWHRHGEDRGLWSNKTIPPNPQDMWADIEDALSGSADWRNDNIAGTVSLVDWRKSQNEAVRMLGSFELVGIWGLLP